MIQLVAERKRSQKRVDDLEIELAKSITKDLVNDLSSTKDGLFARHIHRTDDTGNPLTLLNAITFAFQEATATNTRPYLLVFTSSPAALSATSVTVISAFGSDPKIVKQVGEGLKSSLGVKGGGQGSKFSAKFVGVWTKNKESAAVRQVLDAIE